MELYKEQFAEFLVQTGALQFGDFTLKSGRKSPYFINTGAFDDGKSLSRLGYFYASKINEVIGSEFQVVFGPAYKGIPLSCSTAISLANDFRMSVGYSFNRKEAKQHGDMGVLVGREIKKGDTVVIVDDVVTSGRSIRESFEILSKIPEIKIPFVVVSVDRQEKGKGERGAMKELSRALGVQVVPIITIREIIDYLHNREIEGEVHLNDGTKKRMLAYLSEYGVKDE